MKPKIKATCTKLQLQLLSFCLLCLSGKTRCDGNGPAVVTVEQNSDAVLPCSLSTKEDIEFDHFVWKKAAQKDGLQKEVFYYDAGITYDSGRSGQSEEFKGRVSYFEEGLSQGNASIIIRNTAVTDSGNYTCEFPRLQPRQTFHIKLVVEPVVVTVEQDEDALLPCSRNTENIEQGYFDWNKVAQNNEEQKDVFLYEKGKHTPSFGSQDGGFKDRVFHFQEELKHGNASIMIRNTKMADSGTYTCTFTEPRQTFHIELIVGRVLKDRTGKTGAAPKPVVTTRKTQHGVLLLCEVQGSPQPTVEWQDSAGNILPSGETQVSRRGGRMYFTVNTTVTRSDDFRCVATQETLSHQIYTDIYVSVNGAALKPFITILEMTKDRALLQCVVRGASPKPKVEWKDSSGNKLPAEEPQVTDRGGSDDIILQTTVMKTDDYSCVVTQDEINHQSEAKTHLYIGGNSGSGAHSSDSTGWVGIFVAVLCTVVIVGVVLTVLVYKGCITLHCKKGSPADQKEASRVPLNGEPSRPQEALELKA